MKSREERDIPPMTDASQATRRNWQILIVLEQVPEFQKEVQAIRKRFGIPERGFITDYERNPHHFEYDPHEESRVTHEADSKRDSLGLFTIRPLALGEKPMSDFRREIIRIGEKFRLPFNLYADSLYGLTWYVLRNRISVPAQNWNIDNDLVISNRTLPMRWAVIRAYQPLDDAEAKEAITELNKTLREHLPMALGKSRRMKADTERHLFEVVELLTSEKPERAGDRVAASGQKRALLKRANKLAKELFGYGIKVDTNESR